MPELEPLPEPEPQQAAASAPAGPPPRTLPADFFTSKKPEELAATGAYRNPGALARYPQAIQERAKMLADYDAPVTPYMLGKNPMWSAAAQAAKEYDPSFNLGQYDVRQQTRKAFTGGGKQAMGIQSLNMAIAHLDELRDAAKAEGNFGGMATPLNAPVNWWLSATGDPRPKQFDLKGNAVAAEMVNATRGNGGAEKDIEEWRKSLNRNDSPEQQDGNISGAIDLLAGRIAAARDTYQRSMGKPPYDMRFLNDRSRKVLTGMGYDPDKIEHGIKAADARLDGKSSASPAEKRPDADPKTTYVPGHVYGGMTYLGGDINNAASWKK